MLRKYLSFNLKPNTTLTVRKYASPYECRHPPMFSLASTLLLGAEGVSQVGSPWFALSLGLNGDICNNSYKSGPAGDVSLLT